MGSVRRIAPAADDVTLGGAVDAYLATLFGDRAVFSGGEVGFNDAMFSAGTIRLNDAMFSAGTGPPQRRHVLRRHLCPPQRRHVLRRDLTMLL